MGLCFCVLLFFPCGVTQSEMNSQKKLMYKVIISEKRNEGLGSMPV